MTTVRPAPWHALHHLPSDARVVIDVGCNTGDALEYAHELGATRLLGIDINPAAVSRARERLGALRCEYDIRQGSADTLPFATACADAVLCCEVIEHVPAELRAPVFREVSRVLRPGGTLVLTAPSAGLFSFLDPANARLRFPRVFSLLSRATGGQGREAGYRDQKHGIVWHHHFELFELRSLMGGLLDIELIRWRGCVLSPLCDWLSFPFYRRQLVDHPILRAVRFFATWEMSQEFVPALAYNVLVVARKPAVGSR